MKTAVSIPDDVFEQAEQLAKQTRRSRSRLYADALGEYLARHATDAVTRGMNEAIDAIGEPEAEFATSVSRAALSRAEW